MPRVDVSVAMLVVFKVIPVAYAHILNQARWVELFCKFPHFLNPDLRLNHPWSSSCRRSLFDWSCCCVRCRGAPGRRAGPDQLVHESGLAAEPPCFIEKTPREYGRVIKIALD